LNNGVEPVDRLDTRQFFRVEIRTAAGPSSIEQYVFSGGPYTV
jgi:hypothetical protein